MTGQRIQQKDICYQWFKQRLILSVSKPSISQRSQIKEDTVEPSVPAREFNLKAYAAIPETMIRPDWASNPDLPITVARQRVPRRYQQRQRGRQTNVFFLKFLALKYYSPSQLFLHEHIITARNVAAKTVRVTKRSVIPVDWLTLINRNPSWWPAIVIVMSSTIFEH